MDVSALGRVANRAENEILPQTSRMGEAGGGWTPQCVPHHKVLLAKVMDRCDMNLEPCRSKEEADGPLLEGACER